MKSGSQTTGREVNVSQVSVLPGAGEGAGLLMTRAFMANMQGYVVGFAIMLTAFCGELVLGTGRTIDIPVRLAFRLNHPHNWPGWLFFGILQAGVLFLVGLLIFNRYKEAIDSVDSEEIHIPTAVWAWPLLVTCGLMAIGEVAMRVAMASGW